MNKVAFLLILLLAACSTVPNTETINPPVSTQDYKSVLDNWTRKDESYRNFAAAYQITAILLSREVIEAQIGLDADRFNWSQEETQAARQKALYDLQTDTTFLVSLYTDKDEDNNLEKSNPAWNIFLDASGKRIPPHSVKRVYENRVSLSQKYPEINVWSRNYYLKFSIPTDDASTHAILTLAGPLGTAHLKFK